MDEKGATVEYLNSAAFNEAIEAFKNACERYKNAKQSVENATRQLLNRWEGLGATQFEKNYEIIYMQLEDILELMYEMYNGLIEAQSEYLLTDQELSKQFTL